MINRVECHLSLKRTLRKNLFSRIPAKSPRFLVSISLSVYKYTIIYTINVDPFFLCRSVNFPSVSCEGPILIKSLIHLRGKKDNSYYSSSAIFPSVDVVNRDKNRNSRNLLPLFTRQVIRTIRKLDRLLDMRKIDFFSNTSTKPGGSWQVRTQTDSQFISCSPLLLCSAHIDTAYVRTYPN